MRDKAKWIITAQILLLASAWIMCTSSFGEEATIVGQITENYQLVTTDGTIYEVADTEQGAELLDHTGQKVKATGDVSEDDGMKIITVTSFSIMEN